MMHNDEKAHFVDKAQFVDNVHFFDKAQSDVFVNHQYLKHVGFYVR